MTDIKPQIKTPIVFVDLLSRCRKIEIPLIQRDYAQGRHAEKDVREDFLNTLHNSLSLPHDSAELPLNLDFVYGSMEGQDKKCFLPLDGQQRLTTLFLLHWYLAWQDGCLGDFRTRLWDGKHSRFTYGVRPSSTEFFDAIVSYSPVRTPGEIRSVKRHVENQPWFFLHWRLDPTIQSSLIMLDAIHGRFRETEGLYARLVDSQKPVITFQILPLEHFGLTDDLYIKMNARGKPLTAFETFKARFEDLLLELFPDDTRLFEESVLSIKDFFSLRMDTQWTNFFWGYKDSTDNTFDQALMNLFWVLIRVSLNPADRSFAGDTAALRSRLTAGTYTNFHDRGWLSRNFAENLICLMEAWSENGKFTQQLPNDTYFDEAAFFQSAIHEPTAVEYLNLMLFAAFLFHLKEHEGKVEPERLQEWMRVVYNLTHGSEIERPDEYGRCLIGLQKLVPHSQSILEHLAILEIVPLGFSPQQVREESLKAKLLLSHPEWRTHIVAAEQHGYFRGQIEFLLDFSGVVNQAKIVPIDEWDLATHTTLQMAFERNWKKSQLMFNEKGLVQATDELWRRALLAIGDYLLRLGPNSSFLTDPARNPDSWKRFLHVPGPKLQYLKSLWDLIDESKPVEPQLDAIITASENLEEWRQTIVRHPQVITYCEQAEIRRDPASPQIYLLKKRRMSGIHAELFSYALYLELRAKNDLAALTPLKLVAYYSVTMKEFEPCVSLSFTHGEVVIMFRVFSSKGEFQIFVLMSEVKAHAALESLLRDKCGFVDSGKFLRKSSLRDEIHEMLQLLAEDLKSI